MKLWNNPVAETAPFNYHFDMLIQVRFFAILREQAGQSKVTLELNHGATIEDALALLRKREALKYALDHLPLGFAVNGQYTRKNQPLQHGDELALVPPVSGGSFSRQSHKEVTVVISEQQLSLEQAIETVKTPKAGALVTFSGTTRDVPRLEYEAYVEMAKQELERIAESVADKEPVEAVYVGHRLGRVPLGETSVVIAVSAAHREAAFVTAREIIDQIKQSVPIWKKEIGEEQETWVAGTPIKEPSNEQ